MPRLAFFAHANVFQHHGEPVPVEIALATIPDDGSEPQVRVITVDHSTLPSSSKDWRTNHWIAERIHLSLQHVPGSVPISYHKFSVIHRYRDLKKDSEGGVVVVKGEDQRKMLAPYGLPVINLNHLPKYKEIWDSNVPPNVHKEVHVRGDVSECSMVKAFKFARYLQHFRSDYEYADSDSDWDSDLDY